MNNLTRLVSSIGCTSTPTAPAEPVPADATALPSSAETARAQQHLPSLRDADAELALETDFPPETKFAPEPEVAAEPAFSSVAGVTACEASALSLTPAQRTAIVKLTSGSTRVDAATAAGVTRLTLYRWLNHDPAFQCAYNAWQKDVVTTAQGQMLAATRDAMSAVITAIRKGDARLAWKLLESQGITKAPQPGTTDVDELQRREAMDRKKQEIAERKERNHICRKEMNSRDPM